MSNINLQSCRRLQIKTLARKFLLRPQYLLHLRLDFDSSSHNRLVVTECGSFSSPERSFNLSISQSTKLGHKVCHDCLYSKKYIKTQQTQELLASASKRPSKKHSNWSRIIRLCCSAICQITLVRINIWNYLLQIIWQITLFKLLTTNQT